MSRIWIKLYLETLDDPKMGRLTDRLWRRCVEFFLLAGKQDSDGALPTVDEMAWILRTDGPSVTADLTELEKVGIVCRSGSDWVVTNFKKRQYSESYERVKRYRNIKSNGDGNAGVAEKWSTSTSASNSDSNSSEEEGGMGGETIPTTPREAAEHKDIQLFQEITGWFPGAENYRPIIETFALLRKRGIDLREYLPQYWMAWSTRKTASGRTYSKNSPVWYAEWAMSGKIPNPNGHEPKTGESTKDAIRKVASNVKRK